jgi:hypothetical protein
VDCSQAVTAQVALHEVKGSNEGSILKRHLETKCQSWSECMYVDV